MSILKSEDNKISAVEYYLDSNKTKEELGDIFKCSIRSLMRWVERCTNEDCKKTPKLRFVTKYIGTEIDSSACSVDLLPNNKLNKNIDKITMLDAILYDLKGIPMGRIYYSCNIFPTFWICNGILEIDKKGTIEHTFQFKPIPGTIVVPPGTIKTEIQCGTGKYFNKPGYIIVEYKANDADRVLSIYY